MRKLIFAINMSLDGCCDHTKMSGDVETHDYHAQLLRDADTLLYGRITYQLMVPFWPEVSRNRTFDKSMNEFADAFDSVKQIVVFSRTLKEDEDEKTRIVRGNLQQEIVKLKQEDGKPIVVGGVDLPSQLIQLGLVDEYRVLIQPVVVGEGRRLSFEGISLQQKLTLVESKIFRSGIIALRYLKG